MHNENVKMSKVVKVTSSAAAASTALLVSVRQRGNPILKHIKNVACTFSEIVPDYQMGRTTCALFLSLRYHHLNPNYIHERMKLLGSSYNLRVLLVQVDVKDPHHSLQELAKICIFASFTLLIAWSAEEAGKYLETYKAYEHKPADPLKERTDTHYLPRATDCLTSVRSVNKTDAATLLSNFGNIGNIVQADKDTLSACPGLGPQKADRLHKIFRTPFKIKQ